MLSNRPAPSESTSARNAPPREGLSEDDLAYLSRMTRWLSLDPQEAEDIAQETWLAFQRSPPRELEGKRQWLRVVARRIATRRRNRDRTTRTLLEEPPDRNSLGHESTCDELREVVAQAFRSLPEPYQETVRLRFYEDLKPAGISEALGVSVNTVNSRLQRAQRMLRRKLEPERRGALHWLAGFLAVPFGRREPRPSLRFAPSVQGITVAVAVALTGFVLFFDGAWNHRANQAAEPRRAATLAELPARETRTADRVPEPAQPRSFEAAAHTAMQTVTGHVRDQQGRSVQGAKIYAWVTEQDARLVGTSAADGSFHAAIGPADRLQGPVLGANGAIGIQARAAGWSRGVVHILPPDVTDRIPLVLSPHVADLVIAVETADGLPLEHAAIQYCTESAAIFGPEPDGTLFWNPSAHAEPDTPGTWRVLGLQVGSGTLRVAAPGFAPVSVQLALQAGTQFERVVLTPGTTLSGRVVDARGRPLEHARVTRFVHHQDEDLVAHTGPDGRFSFSNLAAGRMRFAVRDADDRLGVALTATLGSKPVDVGTLVAREQAPHRMRMLDEHERPLGSLTVELRSPLGEPGWVRSALTDDGGWLHVTDAPYDELIVWAYAGKLHPQAGFPLAEYQLVRGTTTVAVPPPRQGTSTFWSTLSSGEAPPGSFLRLRQLSTLAQRRLPLPKAGKLELELESGPYFVTYRVPGKGETIFGHVEVGPGSQHRFSAPALGRVELGPELGRTAVSMRLDQRFGRQHPLDVTVVARNAAPEAAYELMPGAYRLTVSDAEGRSTLRHFEIHPDTTTLLE
ncbi:MAG: sigma-70 family RNA polymerase sigma factor [Planctomycetota bacterium]